jgi:GNAT superfamily N-acetyltransferase
LPDDVLERGPAGLTIREVPLDAVLPLRARILRAGRPLGSARSRQDALPGTRHLAAITESGQVAGVVTYFVEDSPLAAGRRAVRFRGMAVEDALRGSGIGRALMRRVAAAARDAGAEVLWANGRDGALTFYERIGFHVEGDGFLDDDMLLPHHVVIAELDDVTA